jgi:hypothetical protein
MNKRLVRKNPRWQYSKIGADFGAKSGSVEKNCMPLGFQFLFQQSLPERNHDSQ